MSNKFTVLIFNCTVQVFFQKKEKDANIAIQKWIKADSMEFSVLESEAYVCSQGGRIAVWLGPRVTEGIVVHECYHIINDIYNHHGIKAGVSEEADALLMGFIAGKVLKIWKNQ